MVDVAAVIPILKILLRTVKNLDTEEAFFFCLELLGLGIAQPVARLMRDCK